MRKDKTEDDRTLTKAELRRKERYERTKEKLEMAGYEENDLTVGLVYANIMAFVLGIPIIVVLGFCFFRNNSFSVGVISMGGCFLILVIFFALIVIHELIHGISWAIFAQSHWKSVSFGFIAKYMTPYCSCNEALKKGQYILGAAMPTVILGIIPGIVSVFTGSYSMFVISALMILGGGGDLTIILKLLRFRSAGKERLYMDHPYKAGLVVFVR